MADASLLLGQLAEEFTARLRSGELPAVEDYASRHPELSERIRSLFPTLLFLEGMAGAGLPSRTADATSTQGPLDSLAAGQTFNQYRIEREIGRGGMGVVYEATHLPLGKRVALKVLPVLAVQGTHQLERFLREARTAAGLHHTNIVPVFDIGQANGMPYYAMEHIDGRNLDQFLADLQSADAATEGSPPLLAEGRKRSAEFFRLVAQLGVQAAEGLAHAHERGVVHRDIKPSNLLIDAEGRLWITDFGLARAAGDPTLTQAGTLVGTPRYMSPEQAEASRRPVDRRTDVYSLGATLYELMTRRPPFVGNTPVDILLQVIEREPVAPRRLDKSIPRDLETIVLKSMAKRPDDRYQTAAELAEDLRRFQSQDPIRARRIGLAGRTARWVRRNPVVAGLVALVLLTLAGGIAASGYFAVHSFQRARIAEHMAEYARQEEEKSSEHLAASQIKEAQREWEAGNVARAVAVLDSLRQKPGKKDVRSFDWYYLWRQCHAERAALQGLDAPVTALAVSPNGELLATGVENGSVRLWHATDGKPVQALAEALPAPPGDVREYTLAQRHPRGGFALPAHHQAVEALAFAGDGKSLVAVRRGHDERKQPAVNVLRWDLASGKVEQVVSRGFLIWPDAPRIPLQPPLPAGRLALAPDGRLLALATVVGNKLRINVIDLSTGKEREADLESRHLREALVLGRLPLGMAVSADGATLAVGLQSHLAIVDLEPLKVRKEHELTPQGPEFAGVVSDLMAIALSPDGKRVAWSFADPPEFALPELVGVHVWDWTSDRPPRRVVNAPAAFLAFIRDGAELIVAREAVSGQFVEALPLSSARSAPRRPHFFAGHSHPFRALAVSGDGWTLATSAAPSSRSPTRGAGSPEVKLWTANADPRWKRVPLEGNEIVTGLAFSRDGKTLLTCGQLHGLTYFDLTTRKIKARHPLGQEQLRGLAASHDGRRIAVWGNKHDEFDAAPGAVRVYLWDVEAEKVLHALTVEVGDQSRVSCTFTQNGQSLDVLGQRELQRWDVATGTKRSAVAVPRDGLIWAAASPNGVYAIAASGLNALSPAVVWDLPNNRQVSQLDQTGMPAGPWHFNRDERKMVAIGIAGEDVQRPHANLFDLFGDKSLGTWPGASDGAFTHDGRLVAVGTIEAIRFIDLNTGIERLSLPVPEGTPQQVTFSPDLRTMAVLCGPGNVRETRTAVYLYQAASETEVSARRK